MNTNMNSFEYKLDKLFEDAIDVTDTIWYSKFETLRDAIMRIYGDEETQ